MLVTCPLSADNLQQKKRAILRGTHMKKPHFAVLLHRKKMALGLSLMQVNRSQLSHNTSQPEFMSFQ